MNDDERVRLRSQLLEALLAEVPAQQNAVLTVNKIAARVNCSDYLSVREELGRLATLGVIIEGSMTANSAGPYTSIIGTAPYTWPNFTITAYGARYLESARDFGIDCADPDQYVQRASEYLSTLPQIAMNYLSEASRAYGASLQLACVVLVGVAAEAVLEHLYSTLSIRDVTFQVKLEQAGKYRTDNRYKAFEDYLQSKTADVGVETIESIKRVFRPTRDLIKQTRDEAAHHRPVGVNDSRAQSQTDFVLRLVELANVVDFAIKKL